MWSWHPVPIRLLTDRRVLEIDLTARSILLSLYLAADEHGRFDASPTVLCFKLAILDGPLIRSNLEVLAEAGLVHLFTVAGDLYGVIDGWDRDMVATHQKKRPASIYPAPPQEVADLAGCSGVSRKHRDPSGCPVGAQRVPSGIPTGAQRVPSGDLQTDIQTEQDTTDMTEEAL
jgi:hypothetical protein